MVQALSVRRYRNQLSEAERGPMIYRDQNRPRPKKKLRDRNRRRPACLIRRYKNQLGEVERGPMKEGRQGCEHATAIIVMAYMYVVMAYIVMAYMVMAHMS